MTSGYRCETYSNVTERLMRGGGRRDWLVHWSNIKRLVIALCICPAFYPDFVFGLERVVPNQIVHSDWSSNLNQGFKAQESSVVMNSAGNFIFSLAEVEWSPVWGGLRQGLERWEKGYESEDCAREVCHAAVMLVLVGFFRGDDFKQLDASLISDGE